MPMCELAEADALDFYERHYDPEPPEDFDAEAWEDDRLHTAEEDVERITTTWQSSYAIQREPHPAKTTRVPPPRRRRRGHAPRPATNARRRGSRRIGARARATRATIQTHQVTT
jgi:hypothetical protein